MSQRRNRIESASGSKKADLVLKNCKIINVFTQEIINGDIAVTDGVIVGIGEYNGEEEMEMNGRYVAPGLIDGHVHMESAMVAPEQFAKAIVPRGTTTIIADPHEIANVCGLEGIDYMIRATEQSPLDVFFMLPSCVPCTSHESTGAILLAEDLRKLIDHEKVLGLGEVMNFNGVITGEQDVQEKLDLAHEHHKLIDGHGPSLTGNRLNAYVTAGVNTDHECESVEDMLERIRLGMYVQIREGSAARNLEALVKGVNKSNLRRLTFCTDDRHPGDILNDGHIDNNIRKGVQNGLSTIEAIIMATLNNAECYRLYGRGAVAPGYKADLITFEDLDQFEVKDVFKEGVLVASDGKASFEVENVDCSRVSGTIHLNDIKKEDLKIALTGKRARVISLMPHSIVTKHVVRTVSVENGCYVNEPDSDLMKLAVIERHHGTGNIGLGLVEGFGLKNGAIASTISHDSHNLMVIGDSDEAMMVAINEIKRIDGGICIVKDGQVVESLPLPIAGIMSDQPLEAVDRKLLSMLAYAYESLGVKPHFDPFMTLAFLALPVVPEIKLTDKGLFDFNTFDFVNINGDL